MDCCKRDKRAKSDPELLKLAVILLTSYNKAEELIGENRLLKQLTNTLGANALELAMTDH